MKRIIALFLTLVLAAGTTACGGNAGNSQSTSPSAASTSTASKTPKDTLVILSSQSWVSSFAPMDNTNIINIHAEALTLEPLIKLDPETKQYSPCLADSWSYNDAKTVLTVKIKKGIKFHHGEDLSAQDVAASLEAYSDPKKASGTWFQEQLQCKVVDDYTVEVAAKSGKPMSSLVNLLCFAPIMSASDLKDVSNTIAKGYNGTGPYKFVKYDNGTVYFDANENYRNGTSDIKHIVYKYVADATTRLSALQTGEADIIEHCEPEQAETIKQNSNLELVQNVSTEVQHLCFKTQVAPVNNKLVRQAIAYAIDKESIVKSILNGYAKVADSFARGISKKKIYFEYALRNSVIPLLTTLGNQLGFLIGSVVLVEYVFNYPGIGFELMNAITRRDYNLVEAIIIIFSVSFIIINMIIDISYAYLDPRIMKAQGGLNNE